MHPRALITCLVVTVHLQHQDNQCRKGKGNVFPYSFPSAGPGADPGVQAVSPQVTKPSTKRQAAITFHQACGYLPSRIVLPPISRYQIILLGDRGTCCEQPTKGCYLETDQSIFKPATFWVVSEHSTITPHRPQPVYQTNITRDALLYHLLPFMQGGLSKPPARIFTRK